MNEMKPFNPLTRWAGKANAIINKLSSDSDYSLSKGEQIDLLSKLRDEVYALQSELDQAHNRHAEDLYRFGNHKLDN